MQTSRLTLSFSDNYFVNEAFNSLSTNVRFSGPDVKVITVTSCFENEGKTSIVTQLGRHLCIDGRRVLIIDADFRKSVMVSRFTTLGTTLGLSELIAGMAKLDEVLYHTETNGLDVIFAGALPPNPVSLLSHSAFREIINSLRDSYDYILIDTPPMTPVIDAALTAAVSDGCLLIVNRGLVHKKALLSVEGQLKKCGCLVLGIVFNDAQRKNKREKAGFLSLFSRKK